MKKVAWITLAVLGTIAALAIVTVLVDEEVSRDEDEWRLATSPNFQRDFPPGHAKGKGK